MAKVALTDALSVAEEEAKQQGVDPNLAKSIVVSENFGEDSVAKVLANPRAYTIDTDRVSPKGARGVMQVMPPTYDSLKSQGFISPDRTADTWQDSIHAGVASLREIQKRLGSSDPTAIAADYNAGPRGSKAINNQGNVPPETQGYLKKVGLGMTSFGSGGQTTPETTPVTPDPTSQPPAAGRTFRTTTSVQGFDAIEKMVRDNGIYLESLIQGITNSRDQEAAAQVAAAHEIEQSGQAAAEAEKLTGTIKAAQVTSRENLLKLTNMNSETAGNRIAQNLANFDKTEAARANLADEIDRRMSVGLFDDPLQWLVNQTVLPGKVAEHNALARRSNDSLHNIEVMQNVVDNQDKIDVAASADQLAQVGVALGNAKAASANAQADVARAQAASATARAGLTIASLVHGQLGSELEVARMRRVIDAERSGGKSPQDLADEEDFVRRANLLSVAMGNPDGALTMASFKKMNSKQKDQWARRVQKGTIGDDLYEALTFMEDNGNLQGLRAQGSGEFAKIVMDTRKLVVAGADIESAKMVARGAKPLPRDEMLRNSANDIQQTIFATRQNLLLAPEFSPYLASHAKMATAWNGDENNPVWQAVRTATKAGAKLNDQMLFTTVNELVKNNKLTPAQAAQATSDYYTAVIKHNNKSRSPNLIGLEMQDDYVILPKESKLAIDMTNTGQLEHFFTLKYSQDNSYDMAQRFNPMMPQLSNNMPDVYRKAKDNLNRPPRP